MLKLFPILVSGRATGLVLALSTVVLGACGQKGPLYLPTSPTAANRATLPETLKPSGPQAAPPAGAASTPATAR